MRWWLALTALVMGSSTQACADDDRQPDPCRSIRRDPPPSIEAVLTSLDGLSFDALVDASFESLLRRDPELVTELALAEPFGLDNSQLTDVSVAHREQTGELEVGILERLARVDPMSLSTQQRRSADVYRWYLEDRARQRLYADWEYPVTHMIGDLPGSLILFFTDLHPIADVADADDYINRLCQVEEKMMHTVSAIDRAQSNGVVLPRVVFDWALARVSSLATSAPATLDLYTSFVARVAALRGLSSAQREELYARAEAAIESSVLPGFDALHRRLDRQRSMAPATIGLSGIDGGNAYYDALLRHHTTTTTSAADIHALGLDELARIEAEMRDRFDALGYPTTESLSQLFDRVARDGGTITGGAVAAEYERIAADAEARLDEAFAIAPVTGWVVVPDRYGGFYVGPPLDGSRPGAFYAATSGTHPRYSMPTLTHHELIPGHHFQLAIAGEADLPLMRRAMHPTGFIEGWALYAERLVSELGWYAQDPYADLGRLQMEALRAARLVVDTGIHAYGWSFDEAVAFMRTHTGFRDDVLNLTWEVGRYVVYPGQATAYMTGMLELLTLRQRARDRLGGAFDLKAFHTTVLEGGSVPLQVLGGIVEDSLGP